MFKRKKLERPLARQTYIEGLPDMDWGAPSPVILADEHNLSIAYYLNEPIDDWDGTEVHLRNPELDVSKMALFKMAGVRFFSQTSNDSNHGCPYLTYGDGKHMGSHDVWEMKDSTKSIPLFASENRDEFKHLIFAFHDTSLECFCRSYEFEVLTASAANVFNR